MGRGSCPHVRGRRRDCWCAVRLLLTLLATAWVVAVAVAYFWLGLAVVAPLGYEGAVAYWMLSWAIFGAVGAVPFIVYAALDRY